MTTCQGNTAFIHSELQLLAMWGNKQLETSKQYTVCGIVLDSYYSWENDKFIHHVINPQMLFTASPAEKMSHTDSYYVCQLHVFLYFWIGLILYAQLMFFEQICEAKSFPLVCLHLPEIILKILKHL